MDISQVCARSCDDVNHAVNFLAAAVCVAMVVVVMTVAMAMAMKVAVAVVVVMVMRVIMIMTVLLSRNRIVKPELRNGITHNPAHGVQTAQGIPNAIFNIARQRQKQCFGGARHKWDG